MKCEICGTNLDKFMGKGKLSLLRTYTFGNNTAEYDLCPDCMDALDEVISKMREMPPESKEPHK